MNADEDLGKWLLVHKKAQNFITKEDNHGRTPLDEASSIGASWFVRAFMGKYPDKFDSELNKDKVFWIKACENGHTKIIEVLINDNPLKFRNHCIMRKDTPLHHIKLKSLWQYEMFLKLDFMDTDLLNVQNCYGDTPLHIALQNEDVLLTKTLLTMKNIKTDIEGSVYNRDGIPYYSNILGEMKRLLKCLGFYKANKMIATDMLIALCNNEPRESGEWVRIFC